MERASMANGRRPLGCTPIYDFDLKTYFGLVISKHSIITTIILIPGGDLRNLTSSGSDNYAKSYRPLHMDVYICNQYIYISAYFLSLCNIWMN